MTQALPAASSDVAWHAESAASCLGRLSATPAGLGAAEAARRLRQYGPNALPRALRPGPLALFLRQFANPLIYLLVAAAAVAALLGAAADTAFIVVVLLANAAMGAYQEWKAETGAAALERLVCDMAAVRRDGARRELDPALLVPGDIVELESGGRVLADLRLIEAVELDIDESALTGESVPVDKDAGAEIAADAALADRASMAHAGTVVDRGRGVGVVVRTGAATELGRIAGLLAAAPPGDPPLVQRLKRFTRQLALVACGLIALVAGAKLAQGGDLGQVFLVAVALAVAAIPEGLPVAITAALSIAATAMARRNVVVRALPAVEGLGACTVIASDKTGTLTENRLSVARLFVPGHGEIDADAPGSTGGAAAADARRLAESAVLCNEAIPGRDGQPAQGDAVDVAFLHLGERLGIDVAALRGAAPAEFAVPYEPHLRYAASFHRQGGRTVAHVKGAPETVLAMCAADGREQARAAAERLAGEGCRVLAVAAGPVGEARAPIAGLEFLGLVGLRDALRPEAKESVRRSRAAGVGVVMVTGDHPETALAIARELGIADNRDQVMTGPELRRLGGDRAKLAEAVGRVRVFARTEPAQKLEIVEALQEAGHFVAVTGDGVNDAPALRTANIGVAMGISGTDVARGAADLVLADDNFASIVAGIEEGRIAYDNIRKLVIVLVATGASEILLFLLTVAFGLPVPLSPVQLLWLNLATDSVQVIALAFERGEPDVLTRKPRPPAEALFDRRMIEATAIMAVAIGVVAFVFFAVALERGWGEAEARNGLLLLMVLFENAMVLVMRSERRALWAVPWRDNPLLVAGVAAALALHLGAMQVPGLNAVLGAFLPGPAVWLAVVPLALIVVVAMEAYKAFAARRGG